MTWTGQNGAEITRYRTIPAAYYAGHIPSISYGIHVGSAYPNVTGSLVLGGYDSSRCIAEPIASDSNAVQLVDGVRPERIAHLRTVERDADGRLAHAVDDVPVIGDVGEFEALHGLPQRRVERVV